MEEFDMAVRGGAAVVGETWASDSVLFRPSVLTVMAFPRREGPRKSEAGRMVSVLELVAVLLRTAASFLVMVDQQPN
jgi:hypothetical protein